MQKMLNIGEVRASEVMTHRTEVFSLSSTSRLKDKIKLIKKEGYSRIPVYKWSKQRTNNRNFNN